MIRVYKCFIMEKKKSNKKKHYKILTTQNQHCSFDNYIVLLMFSLEINVIINNKADNN